MVARLTVLVILLLLLPACAATGPGIDSCSWTAPILISQDDELTDETARQILEHNNTGAELCGW